MFRRIIVAVLKLALRIYFRRIEVVGVDNIPRDTAVIFVLNHPNALVDPVFLLCLAPRRVSFVAKAPLFRIPVIGYFVRALDALPAYRRQDQGEDVARNLETFAAARRLLAGGGTIGICPEGVSHNEPRLKPLKTGVARMALGAVSSGESIDLRIVPVGLYYTEKTTFRSSALLYFGEPLPIEPVPLNADGTPPRPAVTSIAVPRRRSATSRSSSTSCLAPTSVRAAAITRCTRSGLASPTPRSRSAGCRRPAACPLTGR